MTTTQLPASGLVDRQNERETLDRFVSDVQAGRGQALVLRGEAGVGKTALLEFAAAGAAGCRIARAVGVESEMELPFAGLHALCVPLLGRLAHLPGPQRDALNTAFGLSAGPPPDRFLVALAVLSLLADVAEEEPLVCIVDDAQWLDRVSAQTLAFVGRRLLAERVGLLFGLREPVAENALEGLPELAIAGLEAADARLLLDATITGPLDARVQDRILGEAAGNPLALLELPRGLDPVAVAGGFGLPGEPPLTGRIEQGFVLQLKSLPPETRRLLVLAAAEPVGNVTLLWRAAQRFGVSPDAAGPAQAAGLVEIGARVRFRHPLVRSAAYRAATVPERRQAHQALAEVTDERLDPDRRAWHLARAAAGPDEAVAAELERSADRAQARGGLAAAAAFLEQATALTPDATRRGQRALAAAGTMLRAGAVEGALVLLSVADEAPLDGLTSARAQLLRAQIAFVASHGATVTPLLLAAARRLEPLDDALARETYVEAFAAAIFAGRLARGAGAAEVAAVTRQLPPATNPSLVDQLLDGLTVLHSEGYAAAVETRRRAVRAFEADDLGVEDGLRWLWLASVTAGELWDDEAWTVLSGRHVELARAAGALSALPATLHSRATAHVLAGELAAAEALITELDAVEHATGMPLAPYAALGLAAWRGRSQEVGELVASTLGDVTARGEGIGVMITQWARAVLANGLGRHADALLAGAEAAAHPNSSTVSSWGMSELIEAAVMCGRPETADAALVRLRTMTCAAGTDWALGILARAEALVSGEESLHLEAIARLSRTRIRGELARAHLLYGEWLRLQEARGDDARAQLRTAHEQLTQMGADGFAERARRELLATGETVRRPASDARPDLTPQELQIARLAADGRTNPEIGAQLFISARTVEYHLRKVFGKLEIGSRRALADALPVKV